MPLRKQKPTTKNQNRKEVAKTSKPTKTTKPAYGGRNFHIEFKNEAQSLAWAAFQQHDVLFLVGPAGTGKALTLNSKLYKKTGPIKMADVKIGDEIANPDGGFSKVTGIFPQGKKQICRVHFSDETFVDCCEEHLWEVSCGDSEKKRVVDTKYIEKNCGLGKKKIFVKCTKPVNFDRKNYSIPPYALGFLMANKNSSPRLSSSRLELVGNSMGFKLQPFESANKQTNAFKEELKNLGLWKKEASEKFIPQNYLSGSVDQRISLLQGLMDASGSVKKFGSFYFSTTSFWLNEGFCQLIYSLGGTTKVKIKEGNGKTKLTYRCYFYLPSDVESLLHTRKTRIKKMQLNFSPKKYIDRVERLDFEEMQCISVDHKDSLYLTDNYIVTHNTHLASAFAIEQILNKKRSRIVLTRPIVESGESLGFLPGEFEEKVLPYMMPLYDCMDLMVGKEGPWRERVDQSVEVAPIAYMRGRALRNSELIVTPTDFKPMGEIKVGDYVIGSDGKPTKVTGVYPQGVKPIYEMQFSDGTNSFCSADHLWSTMTLNEKRQGKGYSVKNTEEIMNSVKNKRNQKIHQIPLISAPAEFESKSVSVDPYLLGVLLADQNNLNSLSLCSDNKDLIEECSDRLPQNHNFVRLSEYEYQIQSERQVCAVKASLKKLGLSKTNPENKFVPDSYKFNNIDVRLNLLKGLLDVDGVIIKNRAGITFVQFNSVSESLAKDVMFLVRSLGGLASLSQLKYTSDRESQGTFLVDISIPINPFKLDNKAKEFVNNQKLAKYISSVTQVGEEECTCIKVDAPDHLFLTNDFIVTHNTFQDAVCIFDEAQNASMLQLKLFLTRFGDNSKIIITGDPTQSDIGGKVALVEVMQRLRGVEGVGVVEFKPSSIVRHPLVGKIIEKLE